MTLASLNVLECLSSSSNGMGKWWNKTDEWIEWWKSKKEEAEESDVEEEEEAEESDVEEEAEESDVEEEAEESDVEEEAEESDVEEEAEESDVEEEAEESDVEEEEEAEESDVEEEEVNLTTTNYVSSFFEALTTSTLLTTTSTLLTTTKTPEITTTVSSIFQSIKTGLIEGINETMVNEAQAALDNVESEKSNLVYIVPSIIGSVSLISIFLFMIFRKEKRKVLVEEIPVSTEEDLYLQPTPTLERDEHLYETPLDEFTSEDHLYEFSHPSDYRKKVEEVEEETGLYDLATLEQGLYDLASSHQ